MKKLLLTAISLVALSAQAQVKVGDNPTNVNASAALEIESTSKGFLPPRMTQAQMNAIASPAKGLIIYCTDCNPEGLYINTSSPSPTWSSLPSNSAEPVAQGTIGSGGNCSNTTINGTYQTNTQTGVTNNVVMQVTVTAPGTYSISTNTVNGLTFSASGTFTNAGTQNVTLMANGTPNAAGTYTYTADFNGSTCTFQVTASLGAAVASINCSSGSSAGVYTSGEALNASNTRTITVNVTTAGTYNYTTNTVNGYSFSASGTFAGTGSQTVTLTGSGTPSFAGTNTFTVSGTGGATCTFTNNVRSGKYYVFAQASTQSVAAGTFINWTNLANRNITVSGSNVNLKGGRTYRLTAAMYLAGSNPGTFLYYWTDANGTVLPNSVGGQSITVDYNSNDNSQPSAFTVYSPASDVSVKVKVWSASNNMTTDGRSYLLVEEVPANAQYALAAIGSSPALSTSSNISLSNITNNAVTANTPTSISWSGDKITLQAGKTYRMVSALWINGSGTTYCGYNWVNAATGTALTNTSTGMNFSSNFNLTESANPYATCIFTPSVNTDVALRPIFLGSNSPSSGDRTYAYVEEIPAGIQYLGAVANNQSWNGATATDIQFTTSGTSGDITVTGNTQYTLKAGRTYALFGAYYVSGVSFSNFQWVNSANAIIGNAAIGQAMAANYTSSEFPNPSSVTIFKPTTDTVVKLRAQVSSGGTASISSNRGSIMIMEL